jgi:ribonuclease P protein component
VTTPHFVFLIEARTVDNAPNGLARLGITASRKVGGAVVRNRAKRLVREAFRSTRDLWLPGIDLVVIVKKALVGMRLDDVVEEWRRATASLLRSMDQAQRAQRAALVPSGGGS